MEITLIHLRLDAAGVERAQYEEKGFEVQRVLGFTVLADGKPAGTGDLFIDLREFVLGEATAAPEFFVGGTGAWLDLNETHEVEQQAIGHAVALLLKLCR